MKVNPVIEEITDNGSNTVTPTHRGRHAIIIGTNVADVAFDSGTVTLKQFGAAMSDIGGTAVAATGPTAYTVDGIIDGEDLDFVVTGVAGAAANIDINVYKLSPEDLIV